ncbi:alpha/beta hydrolase [Photorhabdus sp. CRCIA-P01]|uniref:alpha/beta hydrolase n=1 Tax=Photorhabdus sp. CRCIA-P01 TaxID=2019570 RepID=UPI000E59D872|nr:alpha/beta hydrolase [Photorhabdus sp. CRCIA-P01]
MIQHNNRVGCFSLEAVILAPVMPLWDHGDFCTPLRILLQKVGYQVSIIDTLSLINSSDPDYAINIIESELNQRFSQPYLLIGFAMSGTLVQLLASRLKNLTGVISVSGPGYADSLLTNRLEQLIALLNRNQLDEAISVLHDFVIPEGGTPLPKMTAVPDHLRNSARERMIVGFSLLLQLDARTILCNYKGKFLSIVGECSQLATECNQVVSTNPTHCFVVVDGAGMRPWEDKPSFINNVINDWLKIL